MCIIGSRNRICGSCSDCCTNSIVEARRLIIEFNLGVAHSSFMSMFSPPGDCPNCGEFVPADAASCKECGSCPDSGWSKETAYDGLDLPGGSEEPIEQKNPRNRLILAGLLLIAVVVLFVMTKP